VFENEYTWGNAAANNKTDEFHAKFEDAVKKVTSELGKDYPIIVDAITRKGVIAPDLREIIGSYLQLETWKAGSLIWFLWLIWLI